MAEVNKKGKETQEELRWVTDSGKYVGRPSLGPGGHSPRVSFRVPPDLYKAAWARADKEGRSLSDLAREAFNRYMDS